MITSSDWEPPAFWGGYQSYHIQIYIRVEVFQNSDWLIQLLWHSYLLWKMSDYLYPFSDPKWGYPHSISTVSAVGRKQHSRATVGQQQRHSRATAGRQPGVSRASTRAGQRQGVSTAWQEESHLWRQRKTRRKRKAQGRPRRPPGCTPFSEVFWTSPGSSRAISSCRKIATMFGAKITWAGSQTYIIQSIHSRLALTFPWQSLLLPRV